VNSNPAMQACFAPFRQARKTRLFMVVLPPPEGSRPGREEHQPAQWSQPPVAASPASGSPPDEGNTGNVPPPRKAVCRTPVEGQGDGRKNAGQAWWYNGAGDTTALESRVQRPKPRSRRLLFIITYSHFARRAGEARHFSNHTNRHFKKRTTE